MKMSVMVLLVLLVSMVPSMINARYSSHEFQRRGQFRCCSSMDTVCCCNFLNYQSAIDRYKNYSYTSTMVALREKLVFQVSINIKAAITDTSRFSETYVIAPYAYRRMISCGLERRRPRESFSKAEEMVDETSSVGCFGQNHSSCCRSESPRISHFDNVLCNIVGIYIVPARVSTNRQSKVPLQ